MIGSSFVLGLGSGLSFGPKLADFDGNLGSGTYEAGPGAYCSSFFRLDAVKRAAGFLTSNESHGFCQKLRFCSNLPVVPSHFLFSLTL